MKTRHFQKQIKFMRQPNFTPGPWTVTGPREGKSQTRINGEGWSKFAKVYTKVSTNDGPLRDNDEGQANLSLITAAPEMYALLAELEAVDTLAGVFTDRINKLLNKIDGI